MTLFGYPIIENANLPTLNQYALLKQYMYRLIDEYFKSTFSPVGTLRQMLDTVLPHNPEIEITLHRYGYGDSATFFDSEAWREMYEYYDTQLNGELDNTWIREGF